MELPLYQVDAFSDAPFGGNPAAVMPLPYWLDDALLQAIAAENNLSETAFLVDSGGNRELRWFTPAVEVPLCGHATLATAHVLFEHLGLAGDTVSFTTRKGELTVTRDERGLTLDLPESRGDAIPVADAVTAALGARAESAFLDPGSPDMGLYVFESQAQLAALKPDFRALGAAVDHGVIATAPGEKHDFVSRFFGPQVGIDEDPVTGSAHCSLVPYWAERLGVDTLRARQISTRGGELSCQWRDGRVLLTGRAYTYLRGSVDLP